MSAFGVVVLILKAMLVAVFLSVTTYFYAFLERKLSARTQHRRGPSSAGGHGEWQLLADFLKVMTKESAYKPRLIPVLLVLLPFLFSFLLFGLFDQTRVYGSEMMALFLLVLAATTLDTFDLLVIRNTRDLFERRGVILASLIGICFLLYTQASVVMGVGSMSMNEIVRAQTKFPFNNLFSSPGLFLCGLAGLGCPVFLFSIHPLSPSDEKVDSGDGSYQRFWVRRAWLVAFACYWVFLFGGGLSGLLALPFFLIRLFAVLGLLLFAQVSLSRMRSGDALVLAFKSFVPLAILGLLIEVVWMGVWTR